MNRLAQNRLSVLGSKAILPRYDRDNTDIGIVHLGVGAFHRSHQACYTEAVLNQFGGAWGICGVSLRSSGVRDSLSPQDCLYTLGVKHDDDLQLQIVGAIKRMLVAPENPTVVIDALASFSVKALTLTLTEKGYGLHQISGELDLFQPDIAHDIGNLQQPRSAIGYIVAGLQQRMNQGAQGLTLLSCDNLVANGKKLQRAVIQFAEKVDTALALWIQQYCTFPCSMVDRIVPATTDADRQQVSARLGLEDKAAVLTEPFSQWVIEDNFAGEVPAWGEVGAEIVPNVEPFEKMKLSLLNASHSTLAYLGCLAGFTTVADAVADPAFRQLTLQLMRKEMAPTLTGLHNFDLAAYQLQLIERLSNSGLQHFTRQIAADGSQKIPQRFLPGLRRQLLDAGNYDAITLGVAAWIRYTRGIDEGGKTYPVDDPLAVKFAELHQQAGDNPAAYLSAIMRLDEVFEPELANNPVLKHRLLGWLEQLEADGALATVHRHYGDTRK